MRSYVQFEESPQSESTMKHQHITAVNRIFYLNSASHVRTFDILFISAFAISILGVRGELLLFLFWK